MEIQDIVVIGGGAGGLVVTSVAAQLGLRVSLLEKSKVLGGDCLHTGCVPSKTLIHIAKVASLMKHGADYGLPSYYPEINLEAVNEKVQHVIDTIQKHDDPKRFRDYGANVEFSSASFRDKYTVDVGGKLISSKRFVIATGSRPSIPPIPGLQDTKYITNETVFNLKQLPKRLIVLGGGAIGVELAQAFSMLGSEVIILEMGEQLLPALDEDVAASITKCLIKESITIHLSTAAINVMQEGTSKIVECQKQSGEKLNFVADEILVATGRVPQIEDLNLDNAGVISSSKGIQVDSHLRTSAKHIYAVGDVVDSPYKFTHIAEYHAGVVINNAIFHWPKKTDYGAIPSVVYSDPEVATVGMSEKQALEEGIDISVERFEFSDIDRALIEGETSGFAKIILHKGRLLGVSIVGSHAGELISEFTLAINTKIKLRDIAETVHAYPTRSQINRRVVNSYYGKKLFSPKVKQLIKFLRWL